jgi:pilus assembly protein CpaB
VNRKLTGIVASIVLALVGTFILVAYVNSAEDRALAGERTVNVLVVADAIPKGTPAASLSGKVTRKEVPAKVQATGSVTDLKELEGKVASVDLVPGEQVVASRFASPQVANRGLAPAGSMQVTIPLAPPNALGGQVQAGDTVGVVASFEPKNTVGTSAGGPGVQLPPVNTPETTHLFLHKVLVTDVQWSEPPEQEEESGEAAADDVETAPTGSFLVTLALDGPNVERVIYAAEFGSVWLAAEPRDANEAGTRIQTRGSVFG